MIDRESVWKVEEEEGGQMSEGKRKRRRLKEKQRRPLRRPADFKVLPVVCKHPIIVCLGVR